VDPTLDKLHDECGVAAIFDHPEAANLVYLALYALQHRGQESAGIVAVDRGEMRRHAGMGLVNDVFSPQALAKLSGRHAIGHVRYGTAGLSNIENAQPLEMSHRRGSLSIAHNGNLVNAGALRAELEQQGSIFRSTTDTEVILHLVARSQEPDTVDALVEALRQVQGAYCLVLTGGNRTIAVRDPHGFRPLALGRLPDGQPFVASESCAFDLVGAAYLREVEPGEMLVFGPGPTDERSFFPFDRQPAVPCIFEYVYFSRPDSRVFGQPVAAVRRALGRELAREHPVEADVVVPVPDSGVPAALGFAEESGLPFDFGLTRNHYVGRTFIEPAQSIRHFGVKIKLNPSRDLLEGRRVVLVDDSLVRGTTMAKIVHMIREVGAREVHVRISCPPTISPCYYGVDTPSREELIAANESVGAIRRRIEADSLGYLSLEGMHRAANGTPGDYCAACYTGQYPVPISDLARRGFQRQQQVFRFEES
jgi:amidophosphoribosyltransferase